MMPNLSRTQLILLAAGGSAALLAGAFFFQALGYAPCKLCLWQRWPHAVAVACGAVAVNGLAPRLLSWIGAGAALTTAGLGGYHTGVERGWWPGPSTCTGGAGENLGAMSGADLLSTEITTTLVMCDEVAWELLGLSMATYNMLASLAFVALWIMAARR